MNATEKIVRRLRRFSDLHEAIESLEAEIRKAKRAASARVRGREPRTPGSSIEERRKERNERAAEIRDAVMTRAANWCEWCETPCLRLELHHVLSGPERRTQESIETCCGICRDCHRLVHQNEAAALKLAALWAIRGDFLDALRSIERRAGKIERMRGVPIRAAVREGER